MLISLHYVMGLACFLVLMRTQLLQPASQLEYFFLISVTPTLSIIIQQWHSTILKAVVVFVLLKAQFVMKRMYIGASAWRLALWG